MTINNKTGLWITTILLVLGAIVAGILGKDSVAQTCAGVIVLLFFLGDWDN